MRKPNILIFMTDHQRGDTILPEHPAVTPNVERLSREGVTFTQAYCPSPHCCPSRAAFFTGLYPTRSGVWNNVCNDQALSRGLRPGVRLWSEDLAGAGYRLAWSGKWHVSVEEGPRDRGWEERFVSGRSPREHDADWDSYRTLVGRGDEVRGEGRILRPGWGTHRLYDRRDDDGDVHDARTMQGALEALPELARGAQPWVLYVGVAGPHDPYLVPGRFVDRYRLEDVPLPPSWTDDLSDKPRVYRRMRRDRWGQLTERETRDAIRHFWACCTHLDELFGRLLETLERTGQAEDTLVVYVSDHGDYCGDHGLFAKGIPCFRGAYRVPAVVRWPRGIRAPGRRVDRFVSLADFAPTFTEAAGLPVDRGLTGASLLPFLRNESPRRWRDDIHTQCNGVELYYTQRSVSTRALRYVFNGFDDDELYDLADDPHEMRNLAADPAYQARKRDMLRRMWRFAHRQNDTAISGYITTALAPYGPAEAFVPSGAPEA